ncbi:tyrosine-type recombinase/integrase [Burkholderia multivorans]|uniref:tyrosine-type recombinase/integrase n=1 Tax=Burkholderia multivorans TaxID=87883 RepID=UPI00285ECBB0|nr:tyrosine-type recombinase/integrase [Burkholderia multivorans]MDR9066629.1 Prophage integrase IntA [Burkholderia multivorans]MDR9095093.1 Prophage integrase IntA [Burkholderia multivorans]MDR9101529.1 Prophage integrase IntA [Burkholderia multivorans]MDR9119325.1 Prophage integrase IntA [Burkholderia multivorans]MDR9130250.1 Prophage integrase IntA [Burkholderia multivorans]
MLSDTKLRNLKPREKPYKVADRDGLYVVITPTGTISFRYNYRLNGRQETLVLGRYGTDGITLAEARERLLAAKKLVSEGKSPARQKSREMQKIRDAETFGTWAELWLKHYPMAESTRDMRRSVYERDLKEPFGRLKMTEISHEDLRELCDKIVARGAPATAVHAREVVHMVYRYALDRGHRYENPAELVRPTSIARFEPKDRALSPQEIWLLYQYLERVSTAPTIRLAVKLLLLTMVRKSELTEATWDEVNFTLATWTIPAERMKRKRPHVVYLSRQALDIFVALKTCAGGSRYVLPSRYDPDIPMSKATLNQVTTLAWKAAQEDGKPLGKFCVHDLRRTASTLLHEAGYNTDWIEKCLAHEQKGVRAIYNKAEYAEQRRVMLQDWADMIDRWVKGDPALWAVVPPPSSPLSMLRPPSSPMPLIAE